MRRYYTSKYGYMCSYKNSEVPRRGERSESFAGRSDSVGSIRQLQQREYVRESGAHQWPPPVSYSQKEDKLETAYIMR